MSAPAKLRYGWTTGACATAAAKASMLGLATGTIPDAVEIVLPKGQRPVFEIRDPVIDGDGASCFVEKDAGDDPDVTHGALIGVRAARAGEGDAVRFIAGEGVGTVTKPGLPVPVGEPAINPIPRAMMLDAVEAVRQQTGARFAVDLTVSVPGGAELALKTWNPRLGIVGGISILGTTGIVRPFSCSAWIASIHRGIDVAVANGLDHVVGATGSTSEAAMRALHPLPEIAFLDMGDFVGGLLKYLRNHPVPRLTLAGGPGKMSKLAQGALDLHSKRSQVDIPRLADWAQEPRVLTAHTALEAFEIGGEGLAQAVAARAALVAGDVLRGAPVAVEAVVVDRQGAILARAPSA